MLPSSKARGPSDAHSSIQIVPEPPYSPPIEPARSLPFVPQVMSQVYSRRLGPKLLPFFEYTIFPAPNETGIVSIQLWIPVLGFMPGPPFFGAPMQQDPVTFADSLAYEAHLRHLLWPNMTRLHPAFADYMNYYVWPHLDGHHRHYVKGSMTGEQHPELKGSDWPPGFLPALPRVPSSTYLQWFTDVKPKKKYSHRRLGRFAHDTSRSSRAMSKGENPSSSLCRSRSISTSTPTIAGMSTHGLSAEFTQQLSELHSQRESSRP